MKAFRILLFTLVLLLFTSSARQQEEVYINWGSNQQLTSDPLTYTKFNAYVTRSFASKDQYHKWEYKFYLVSQSSVNSGSNSPIAASTWFYGLKVIVNNNEITRDAYPLGMTYAAIHRPIHFYYLKSNDDTPRFRLSWDNAVYDPRGGGNNE